MPLSFAFKIAQEAAAREGPIAAAFSREVAKFTGSRFSHVEAWISGTQDAATCFSSREPSGTGIKTIDLSDPLLWEIVPVTTTAEQDLLIKGFCLGSSGRPYDFGGILQIGIAFNIHDAVDRFCSESVFELGQVCAGLFQGIGPRWMVAPSWPNPPAGRYGLYELLKQSIPSGT